MMHDIIKSKLILPPLFLLLLMASGCTASVGRDFSKPEEGYLVLGETTEQQVRSRYGEPQSTGSGVYNDQPVSTITYSYSSTDGTPLIGGITPARALSCHFHDGTLAGYEFLSSFRKDHTSFDQTKREQIEIGASREEDVVRIMGRPNGEHQQPLIDAPHEKALVYSYSQTLVKGDIFNLEAHHGLKQMTVLLDGNGVVQDLKFSDTQT